MKKNIFFIVLVYGLANWSYCQEAKIVEVKKQPKSEIFNTKEFTITFPIVKTANKGFFETSMGQNIY